MEGRYDVNCQTLRKYFEGVNSNAEYIGDDVSDKNNKHLRFQCKVDMIQRLTIKNMTLNDNI